MEINIPLRSFFLLFGACQGILLSLFMLFAIRKNNQANVLIGILLMVISLNILFPELVINAPDSFIHLLGLTFPLMFTFGPLMYFYTLFKTNRIKELRAIDSLHFLIAVIAFIVITPFILKSSEVKIDLYVAWTQEGLPTSIIIGWLIECIHIITYLIIASLEILRFHKKLKTQRSNLDSINLKWLLKLLLTNELVWWAYVGMFVLYLFGMGKEGFVTSYYIFSYLISGMVYVVGYAALKSPEIYISDDTDKKYEKSGLDSKIGTEYFKTLSQYMKIQQPYKKSNLTLKELAEMVAMHPNHLSQVINEHAKKNFFDFINFYRIEDAKEKLSTSHSGQTIIEIAYSVGFNTKSTFNGAFKKNTGSTPSAFKSSLKTNPVQKVLT